MLVFKHINRYALAGLTILALLCVTGCGTLERSVGMKQLSSGDIDYIDKAPMTQRVTFNARVGEQTYTFNKTASFVVPICYCKAVGKYEDSYGVLRQCLGFPLFRDSRFSMFDRMGHRTVHTIEMGALLLFDFERIVKSTENSELYSRWQLDFFPIPLFGSLFGFGTDYFRFLFIPFSTPDKEIEELGVGATWQACP